MAERDRNDTRESQAAPLVSIGMPVFNGERYLEEALNSILAQTLTSFELVISDNASTDRTGEICKCYAARDTRIRYLRNESNIGAHPNYNRTFHEASGRYFKWAPHDDVLRPGFLEACVAVLERNPEGVICQTLLEYFDDEGRPVGVYDSNLVGMESDDAVERFAAVVLRPHPCYEVMGVFRRSALEGSLLLESFHGADRALLAEMALRGRFLRVPEPLLVVRDHKERYTRSKLRPKDRAVWHDARLAGRLSFPTWRLYLECWRMPGRDCRSWSERLRARGVLLRWWFHNYNAGRMVTDVLAAFWPDAVGWAERLKQKLFAPAPGADETKRASRHTGR